MAVVHLDFGSIITKILGGIAALSVVVEFTPIKINPISSILKWIGKRTNQELENKVNTLCERVDTLEEADVVSCRVRILGFADEIRRNIRHSQETFDQVLSDIDTYEKYCDSHPDFKNKKTVAAKEKIMSVYSKCIDNNDFL